MTDPGARQRNSLSPTRRASIVSVMTRQGSEPARIVRDGAGFRLAKPADLTAETWPTRSAAHHAVRNKLKGRALAPGGGRPPTCFGMIRRISGFMCAGLLAASGLDLMVLLADVRTPLGFILTASFIAV